MRPLLACSLLLLALTVPCVLVAEDLSDHRALDDRVSADSLPALQLSMQEWGVWQLDAGGHVRSLEDLARESPAFVHRQLGVPGPVPELPGVLPIPQIFDKPVVFFFAQRPIDVTVTVRVPNGRPWLFYPSATLGRVSGDAALRFQGRVLAQQAPLPAGVRLPTAPDGHWWRWLRGVDASPFVTAEGGEAERFLFYDGQAPFPRGFAVRGSTPVPVSPNVDMLAWVIDGNTATRLVMRPGNVSRTRMVSKAEVEGELRARLMMRGLSGPVADSLISTWRPELFASRDRRVIWLLSRAAYDTMLPIDVVPAPGYTARVGVVIEKY